MFDDFLSLASDDDQELRKEIRSYLSTAAQGIQANLNEFQETPILVLTGQSQRLPAYKIIHDIDIRQIPVDPDAEPECEEARKLCQHIKTEYDLEFGKHELRNLLVDAFGMSLCDIDDWESKVPDIASTIKADTEGFIRERKIHILGGLRLTVDEFSIGDLGRVIRPQENKIYAKESPGHILSNRPNLLGDCLLETRVTAHRDSCHNTHTERHKREYLFTLFHLYGPCNVNVLRTHSIPGSYKAIRHTSEPLDGTSGSPSFELTKGDLTPIENLIGLLDNFYNKEDGTYQRELDVAVTHYKRSIVDTSYHTSVTFAIIGLESIYKQYLDNSISSSDVSRFTALTLGQSSERFDANEILKDIQSGYNRRNNLVHGGELPNQPDHEHKEALWDYLRISIVLHAWLLKNGDLEHIELESAMVNDKARQNLQEVLSHFDIDNYLHLQPTN